MRYRANRDFILEGTLIAYGDSLFLQQAPSDQYEVYSLFTRKLIGSMKTENIKLFLTEDNNPKEKFVKKVNKSKTPFKDIPLILLLFIMPLGASTQVVLNIEPSTQQMSDPIKWTTKMVQTEDNIFELHLSAKIDSNWFLYPLNERKKCEYCPVLRLEPTPFWEALDGPALYTYGKKWPKDRCGSLPDPYCPVERYTDSVIYIQVVKNLTNRNVSIKGYIEYYPTGRDSVGVPKRLMFARSLYSTSEQKVTRTTVP